MLSIMPSHMGPFGAHYASIMHENTSTTAKDLTIKMLAYGPPKGAIMLSITAYKTPYSRAACFIIATQAQAYGRSLRKHAYLHLRARYSGLTLLNPHYLRGPSGPAMHSRA